MVLRYAFLDALLGYTVMLLTSISVPQPIYIASIDTRVIELTETSQRIYRTTSCNRGEKLMKILSQIWDYFNRFISNTRRKIKYRRTENWKKKNTTEMEISSWVLSNGLQSWYFRCGIVSVKFSYRSWDRKMKLVSTIERYLDIFLAAIFWKKILHLNL